MNRKWVWAGMVVLPLLLLVTLKIAQNALSWKPRLIITHPGGSCFLKWSSDGRSVQISPSWNYEFSKWGTRSAPMDSSFSSAQGVPSSTPHFELEAGAAEPGDLGKPSVVLLSKLTKSTTVLQGTPWDMFGYDNTLTAEGWPIGWRFQDSRFSTDWREVSIVSGGTIYTWSTSTGKLLRRVCFDGSEDVMHTVSRLSPNGRLIIDRTNKAVGGDFVRGAVFDDRTGQKKFDLPANADFAAGFNLDGSICWTGVFAASKRHIDSLDIAFFDTSTGRRLWHVHAPSLTSIEFLPQQSTVVIPTTGGLELRDMFTGKVSRTLKHPNFAISANDIAASPDGSQIWASYPSGQVWSWRVR